MPEQVCWACCSDCALQHACSLTDYHSAPCRRQSLAWSCCLGRSPLLHGFLLYLNSPESLLKLAAAEMVGLRNAIEGVRAAVEALASETAPHLSISLQHNLSKKFAPAEMFIGLLTPVLPHLHSSFLKRSLCMQLLKWWT